MELTWQPDWLVPHKVQESPRYHHAKPNFEIQQGHKQWHRSINITNLQPDDTGLYVCVAKDFKSDETSSYDIQYDMFYLSNWDPNSYSEEVNKRRLQAVYAYVSGN